MAVPGYFSPLSLGLALNLWQLEGVDLRDFSIGPADPMLADSALEALLWEAYVNPGHTSAAIAQQAFVAAAVRARGELLVAMHRPTRAFVGCIVLVGREASGRRVGEPDEAELQLLAVAGDFRQRGLGEALVRTAMQRSVAAGCSKFVLWTQPTMLAAARLYLRCGFVRSPARDFERAGQQFLVLTRG